MVWEVLKTVGVVELVRFQNHKRTRNQRWKLYPTSRSPRTVSAENAVPARRRPVDRAGAAAALGIGLAAIGAGYAERGIGAAVVGALAEDSISPGIGILLTVLPETL